MNRILSLLLLSLSISTFYACGSEPADNFSANPEFAGAPKWVISGCTTFFEGKEDVLCGVGGVNGTKNVNLQRTAAEGRSRTAIARALNVKIKSMLKDYQATVTGGKAFNEAADDEQYITDVAKQLTNISLSGTKTEDVWMSGTGNLYVLTSLDLKAFKDSLGKMKELNAEVRKAVEERATSAFKELDKALQEPVTND
jgi:hypothetical protein